MATSVDRRQAIASAASFSQPQTKTLGGKRTKAGGGATTGTVAGTGSGGNRPTARSGGSDFGPQGRPTGGGTGTLATYGIPQPRPAAPSGSGMLGNANGSTAVPPVPGANDPAYLTYLRQFGIDESMANLMSAHNISVLERQLGRALPAYAKQREDAITNTGAGFEGRGMYRSGSRIVNQSDAALAVDRERDDFQARIYDQIRQEIINAMSEVASLRRQLLEQGYDSATATAIANAEAGIF